MKKYLIIALILTMFLIDSKGQSNGDIVARMYDLQRQNKASTPLTFDFIYPVSGRTVWSSSHEEMNTAETAVTNNSRDFIYIR